MDEETGRAAVRRIDVPDALRDLATLPRVDYADAFVVDAGRAGRHSGEEWARVMLEEASPPTRESLRRGWWLLGLKVAPAGEEGAVLGWRVLHSDEDFALLGLRSRLGMPAQLLLRPEAGRISFCTFVEHRNPLMRALWKTIEGLHGEVVARLLARTERRWAEAEAA